MNVRHILKFLVLSAGFAVIAAPRASAQSEIDPDHFGDANTQPFPQPNSKTPTDASIKPVSFSGKLALPYGMKCAGKKLPAGGYAMSLRFDGQTGDLKLNQKGQTIQISGKARKLADGQTLNAFFVERVGSTHSLAAVRVKELQLDFSAASQPARPSRSKPKRLEELPITLVSSQNE